MSDSDPASGGRPQRGDAEQEAGILGNLPRSRPSVRSPRRASPRPETPERSAEPVEERAEQPERGREAEIEALARAGLSLAGGAATLGLKAAGRAAAALRDAVERR